jgi:hypothetical protein
MSMLTKNAKFPGFFTKINYTIKRSQKKVYITIISCRHKKLAHFIQENHVTPLNVLYILFCELSMIV